MRSAVNHRNNAAAMFGHAHCAAMEYTTSRYAWLRMTLAWNIGTTSPGIAMFTVKCKGKHRCTPKASKPPWKKNESTFVCIVYRRLCQEHFVATNDVAINDVATNDVAINAPVVTNCYTPVPVLVSTIYWRTDRKKKVNIPSMGSITCAVCSGVKGQRWREERGCVCVRGEGRGG